MSKPRLKRAFLTGLGLSALMVAVIALMTSTTWGRRQLVLLLDDGYPTTTATGAPTGTSGQITLAEFANGLRQPVDIQAIPGHTGVLAILQKEGRASRVREGKVEAWFEVSVRTRSEQGLLGLAFHPKFSQNGRFFLNYSPKDGEPRTRVAEWHANPSDLSKPHEVREVLAFPQPYPNHDAGQLQFGPDGMLYIGAGDGGYRDDPHGHGQNLNTLLGSMLRIDVDGKPPYAVPPDNPFVGRADARPEIWAYGLRNPWRYAFAPDGRLVVGDVGQNSYEEITIVGRGENHGWNVREAEHCFPKDAPCEKGEMVDPIWSYGRDAGISVTGGVVYTGKHLAGLAGQYLFGDFGTGRIWALSLPKDKARVEAKELGRWPISISAFGVDHAGEVYVADFGGGRILKVAPK